MATIIGISAVNGPSGPVPSAPQTETTGRPAKPAPKSDSVEVSAAASSRASLADEIRQAQVDAAKKRLEEGTYKLQATVLQVASRVAALVE